MILYKWYEISFFEGTQVFVIWNWELLEDTDVGSDSEASNGDELEPHPVDTDDDEEEPGGRGRKP